MVSKIPTYLGKDLKSDAYFFLAEKQGINRFIKFVRYPMWVGAKHLVDFLDKSSPPGGMLEEVAMFVNGELEFEVVPKSRGKPQSVNRIVVPILSNNLAKEGEDNVPVVSNRSKSQSQALLESSTGTGEKPAKSTSPQVNEVESTSSNARSQTNQTTDRIQDMATSNGREGPNITGGGANGSDGGDIASGRLGVTRAMFGRKEPADEDAVGGGGRVSGPGVLGSDRDVPGELSNRTPVKRRRQGAPGVFNSAVTSIDSSSGLGIAVQTGNSPVGSPDELQATRQEVKVKRKRRTKAEMELARAASSSQSN